MVWWYDGKMVNGRMVRWYNGRMRLITYRNIQRPVQWTSEPCTGRVPSCSSPPPPRRSPSLQVMRVPEISLDSPQNAAHWRSPLVCQHNPSLHWESGLLGERESRPDEKWVGWGTNCLNIYLWSFQTFVEPRDLLRVTAVHRFTGFFWLRESLGKTCGVTAFS